jgi:lipoprotein-anchoring transpeptidase ErfK/SrfK
MTRARIRASRALVVFLVLSLVIVIVVAKGRKPAAPLANARVLPATPAAMTNDHPRPLLVLASNLIAPTTLPTTLPTTQPLALAPTTRPILHEPPPQVVVTPPLVEARARLADDPLATRRILSGELLAGHLSGAELDEARELLSKANEQLIFSPRVFRDDPFASAYTIQAGDRIVKIAAAYGMSPELLMRINNIPDPRRIRPGQQIKVIRGPFHAVVGKHQFTMDIYLGAPGGAGSTFITSYRVGLGKDDSTPLGSWKAAGKLKNPAYYSPRGEGIIAADDPKNPLGEYWIGLTGIDGGAVGKNSYGIHGTIDAASIGREESMGCIRMRNEDVAVVYELLVEGRSTIIVRD